MLLAEIKHDDCEDWVDWMEFGDCITIHQALRIPLAVPTGAVSRIRLVEPDEAQFRKMRRSGECDDCQECTDCEACMDCRGCDNCYDCRGCINCTDCRNCEGCEGCINCYDCVGCIGLVNASGIRN